MAGEKEEGEEGGSEERGEREGKEGRETGEKGEGKKGQVVVTYLSPVKEFATRIKMDQGIKLNCKLKESMTLCRSHPLDFTT